MGIPLSATCGRDWWLVAQPLESQPRTNLPIIELAMCVCMCVCMYVSHVLDRKLLERLMSPSPKSQVMFAPAFSWIGDFFSNFWDSYFSSYGEFGEFSLRFLAPLSGRSLSNKAAHHITAKIGDTGCIRLHVCSTPSKSPSWTLGQPGTVSGQRAAYASGPTLREIGETMNKGVPLRCKM